MKIFDNIEQLPYNNNQARGGLDLPARMRGGDNMTVLEVLELLNLLAVVVFGVITITKKK